MKNIVKKIVRQSDNQISLLNQFFSLYLCFSVLLRPNSTFYFRLINFSQAPLKNSFSSFNFHAWAIFFQLYKETFSSYLIFILHCDALTSYESSTATIISNNLSLVLLVLDIIQQKLKENFLS